MLFTDTPSRTSIATVRYLSYVFLLGAVASAVAWMVYVAKWNIGVYNPASKGDKTYPLDAQDELSSERYTICFQGVVASVLLYAALRHMNHHTGA
jgi:hypothetical protein